MSMLYTRTTQETFTREQLIDKYRSVEVDSDWYDITVETFCSELSAKGWSVDPSNVAFRGFWSQGDGASFVGTYEGTPSTTPGNITDMLDDETLVIQIERKHSRYVHERTCYVDADIYPDDDAEYDAALEIVAPFVDSLEAERITLCQELYSRLEQEHEYLTSDAVVWEWIEANVLGDYTLSED